MNIRLLLLPLVCCMAVASAWAKEYTLTLKVRNLPQTQAVLFQQKGDRTYPVDTVQSSPNGTIRFGLKDTYTPGMYTVTVHDLPVWVFIFNKENVEAEIDLGAKPETAQITASEENIRYYRFVAGQAAVLAQIETVRAVIDMYPAEEDFYARAVAEYTRLRGRHDSLLRAAMKGPQGSIAKIYASAAHQMVMPLSVPRPLHTEYAREHYFDQLILSDTSLIYSDLFTSKLLKYYAYYSDKKQTKDAAQQAYLSATDTILRRMSPYPDIYRFAANFLMDGFEAIGQEAVADYIAEHYSQQYSCESAAGLHGIDRKAYSRTKLRKGAAAPTFAVEGGAKTFVYNAEPERTVVLIFWATWCQHCLETMPQVERRLREFVPRGVEVVSISLDTDIAQWSTFTASLAMESVQNFCPGLSWESPVAQHYAVYATPTFFVLSGGLIADKPMDLKDVPASLRAILDKQ